MAAERLTIEVAWVDDGGGHVMTLEVPHGATVLNALERARLDERVGLDWRACRWGVFGRVCGGDTLLEAGDRVEVYLPLLDEPRNIRRRRASAQRR